MFFYNFVSSLFFTISLAIYCVFVLTRGSGLFISRTINFAYGISFSIAGGWLITNTLLNIYDYYQPEEITVHTYWVAWCLIIYISYKALFQHYIIELEPGFGAFTTVFKSRFGLKKFEEEFKMRIAKSKERTEKSKEKGTEAKKKRTEPEEIKPGYIVKEGEWWTPPPYDMEDVDLRRQPISTGEFSAQSSEGIEITAAVDGWYKIGNPYRSADTNLDDPVQSTVAILKAVSRDELAVVEEEKLKGLQSEFANRILDQPEISEFTEETGIELPQIVVRKAMAADPEFLRRKQRSAEEKMDTGAESKETTNLTARIKQVMDAAKTENSLITWQEAELTVLTQIGKLKRIHVGGNAGDFAKGEAIRASSTD